MKKYPSYTEFLKTPDTITDGMIDFQTGFGVHLLNCNGYPWLSTQLKKPKSKLNL
jgi:hypothetical protein